MIINAKKLFTVSLLSLFISFQAFTQNVPVFKNGDTIAFVGNSITEAGFYESNIWLYYMTHFPNEKITIYNAGIGGDVVGQMSRRFEYDVLPKKPDYIVLTFGMNDTGYMEFNQPDSSEKALERINKSFKDFGVLQSKLRNHPEIKPIIMSSSPYDETMKNKNNYYKGKSKAMEQIVSFQKKAAEENNWPYVDLFHPMTQINLHGQRNEPTFTITGPDRIHPGRGGHLVMAGIFLESQGLANIPVARIDVDVKKGVLSAENADVRIIGRSSTGLKFDYLANSLPFPIDSVSGVWENPQTQADALSAYPFIQKFNQEILKIKNLKKGRYDLIIDGELIKTYSSDSLSQGINLALLSNTPQYRQAIKLMYLNDLRLSLEKKLREYYWLQYNYFADQNLLFDDSEFAFEKVKIEAKTNWFVKSKLETYYTARFPKVREMWQNDINLLVDQIYTENRPKKHLFEIRAKNE